MGDLDIITASFIVSDPEYTWSMPYVIFPTEVISYEINIAVTSSLSDVTGDIKMFVAVIASNCLLWNDDVRRWDESKCKVSLYESEQLTRTIIRVCEYCFMRVCACLIITSCKCVRYA